MDVLTYFSSSYPSSTSCEMSLTRVTNFNVLFLRSRMLPSINSVACPPKSLPAMWSVRKCCPAKMRLSPASSAAAEKLVKWRVTPASDSEVTSKVNRFPKKIPTPSHPLY